MIKTIEYLQISHGKLQQNNLYEYKNMHVG